MPQIADFARGTQPSHQLYFASLFDPGRALAFPCDRRGEVPLDDLDERARFDYFFARVAIGRDYRSPVVVALDGAVL